jgi:alcohol dehydrogenase class IV
MIPFSLEMPAAVHFGSGSLAKLPELVDGPGKRVLLVVGRHWLASSGLEGTIGSRLAGCIVERISCPGGEPTTESLDAAAAVAARFAPDLILGLGGGSVLDTSKALSALLRFPGAAERFLEGLPGAVPIPGPCVPWIAVPTTAGTGAEATKNAVVRAPRLGVKRSMRSSHLLARAVLVDPELTLSLPPRITGMSGLDALTQLVEAYVSRTTTPIVQSLVEGAFAPMVEALRGLSASPQDGDLRARASYGALVSGIALANAGLGAAHGFAAAIGGMFEVPHGLACAVLLPHVLEANREIIEGRIARLAAGNREVSSGTSAVTWLAAEVRRLLRAFGLPETLHDYRIPSASVSELAEKSSGSSMRGNPRDIPASERAEILSAVI